MSRGRISVVGAGPVGALTAIVLARHGYRVDLFEGRRDTRKTDSYEGRSINIALSDRGWHSLARIGVETDAKRDALPMSHRAVHDTAGAITDIPYGKPGEAIWSVSRSGINARLLDVAEAEPNVTLHFEHRLVDVAFDTATTHFQTPESETVNATADTVIAADGANSKVRRLAAGETGFTDRVTTMAEAYIELTIPAGPNGAHRLDVNALHIWPRKTFMLIALPNPDGTFTATLFLAADGPVSFAALDTPAAVAAFFDEHFADAVPLLDDPVGTFLAKRPAPLVLVEAEPWSFADRVGLIGDAAHAIVPYYGQGMNCGFEDCAELNDVIAANDYDWPRIFAAFEAARKPNADAIAELALRNFVEMSDLSGDKRFQVRKKIEAKFSEHCPELWTPLYSMVTFSPTLPYAEALRIGDAQDTVMDTLMSEPGIEEHWDQPFVMERLQQLATRAFGEAP
ncbi:MAG: NAD(P)/FAD-dependent oxidoreductase [Pseudomonadota bacterium]